MFFKRKGLMRNEKGVTAIEFALIAPIFFAFILGIMDIGIYFFVTGQLQHAVVQASRELRTNSNAALIGTTAGHRQAFRDEICSFIQTGLVSSCTTSLRTDVVAFPDNYSIVPTSFSALDANGDGILTDTEMRYSTGGSSCAVVVRVYYSYSTLFPALQNLLAAVVPGTTYLTAATAFRTEPFTGGIVSPCAYK